MEGTSAVDDVNGVLRVVGEDGLVVMVWVLVGDRKVIGARVGGGWKKTEM